jgi:hypothetical protein
VKSKDGATWNLIGFAPSKTSAEDKAKLRLKYMPRGSKSKLIPVKKMEDAKERL